MAASFFQAFSSFFDMRADGILKRDANFLDQLIQFLVPIKFIPAANNFFSFSAKRRPVCKGVLSKHLEQITTFKAGRDAKDQYHLLECPIERSKRKPELGALKCAIEL